MKNPLEQKIIDFASKPENIEYAWAFLKVGLDSGDPLEVIMQKMLIDQLMRFHGIPYQAGQN